MSEANRASGKILPFNRLSQIQDGHEMKESPLVSPESAKEFHAEALSAFVGPAARYSVGDFAERTGVKDRSIYSHLGRSDAEKREPSLSKVLSYAKVLRGPYINRLLARIGLVAIELPDGAGGYDPRIGVVAAGEFIAASMADYADGDLSKAEAERQLPLIEKNMAELERARAACLAAIHGNSNAG